MPLSWAPGWSRNQLIRKAAKILAIQRELASCSPDQWRIQELARLMLTEVADAAKDHWQIPLRIMPQQVRYLQLDDQSETIREEWLLGILYVGSGGCGGVGPGPCLHLATEENPKSMCGDGQNLLADAPFWTQPYAHEQLKNVVGLHSMACFPDVMGPWQKHDPKKHAVHRAAMAAYLCELAYNECLQWNPPWLMSVKRPLNPVGLMHTLFGVDSPEADENSVEKQFIEPWRDLFQAKVSGAQIFTMLEGGTAEWKFLRNGEYQWSLELCWAIVKESYRVRLDCPPMVLPIPLLESRGDLSLEQAVFHFLVDHAQGPRMKAAAAARRLGKDPHAVHEMLSQTRRMLPRPTSPSKQAPWDPLVVARSKLFPMAMQSSDSAQNVPPGYDGKAGPAKAGKGGETNSEI